MIRLKNMLDEAYDHNHPNVKDNPTIIPKTYLAKLPNHKAKADGYIIRDGSHFYVSIIDRKTKQQMGGGKANSLKDAVNYLKKKGYDLQPLRDAGILKSKTESVDEAQMHAYTQDQSLKMIWQLKVNLKKEPDIMKLLNTLETKIKAYEPR